MHIKQTKDRTALIEAGMAKVGYQKLDYLGEPTDHKAWRRQAEKKRMGNHVKSDTDIGRGAESKGAKHVAGDQSGKEE